MSSKFVHPFGEFKLECQMDSIGLLKLSDTRETSQYHNVKNRLMIKLRI